MNRYIHICAAVISVIAGISCAGGGVKTDFLAGYDRMNLNSIIVGRVDPEKLLERMEKLAIKLAQKDKISTVAEYDAVLNELLEITAQYSSVLNTDKIADYDEGSYIIPPMTEVEATVDTYCLDLFGAVPKKNEPYVLSKSDPEIPLYREIMYYTNTKESAEQRLKQKLFWNLGNHVKFENLSAEEQALLLKADTAAYLKVDNYLKDAAKKLLFDLIPGLKKVKETAVLQEGVAHKYEDYAASIVKIVSKYSMPEISGPIKAEGYELYTVIEPSSYHSAKIRFINTGTETIRVKSFFKPVRKDVQPLGFDLPESIDNTLKQKIKLAFGKLVAVSIENFEDIKFESGDKITIEENPDRLVDIWKVSEDGLKAKEFAVKMCKENPGMCSEYIHNCIGDAIRHAAWNALMERDAGDFAVDAANNHELNESSVPKEAEMDKYNNEIGRKIGKELVEKGITDDKAYFEEVMKNRKELKVLIK